MGVRAGTLQAPERTATGPKWVRRRRWTVPAIAVTVAAGIGLSIGLGTWMDSPEAGRVPGSEAARIGRTTTTVPQVTGTGPGLIVVANWGQSSIPKVTGTGPGLIVVADWGQSSIPKVTGTGPGLIVVADASKSRLPRD
jgi:hypothetical protein